MSQEIVVIPEEIERLYQKLKREAEAGGYHLNPDVEFTKELVASLLINEKRYGYWACPCRLATGKREEDLDIVCPCDYRDPDLVEHGCCYCALYVSQDVAQGKANAHSIPERRPLPEVREAKRAKSKNGVAPGRLPLPVWRCKVCGYLCGRERPPEICPICKAKKERFEIFMR